MRAVASRGGLAVLLAAALLVAHGAARAGTSCEVRPASPETVARATRTALRAQAALDARDAPAALVARVGTDLSRYGLTYSHVGFAVRDHRDGRWTMIHELNECGTARSTIRSQGLVNFFADDLVTQQFRVVWLDEPLAAALTATLARDDGVAWHDRDYNVIARYDSERYQNSTAWVLEVLVAAATGETDGDRRSIHRATRALGFTPDALRIAYSKRIVGGLFSANAVFTDHPVAARLGGRYEVVTARAILRFLREQRWIAAAVEFDVAGREREPRDDG